MLEVWKPITDFEERYLISNLGRVKSLHHNRVMRLTKHRVGYMQIGLWNGTIQKFKLIHRLVAVHFIQNESDKKEVNHLDLDKENNKIDNLEWCTHKENMEHAKNIGFRLDSRV